jgi:hypothetical protein
VIRITMLNNDTHDSHHGSVSNERRWCRAFLLNEDIVSAALFYKDSDELEVTEEYSK